MALHGFGKKKDQYGYPVDKFGLGLNYDLAEVSYDPFQPVNLEDDEPTTKGYGSDFLTSIKKGALQIPSALTGLADIPAGLMGYDRPFDKATDYLGGLTGFTPEQWSQNEADYSPEMQQATQNVNAAWNDPNTDWRDVAQAYLQNPRAIGKTVAESVPSMLAGGAIGKALLKGLGGLSAIPAASVGEGTIMAGQSMNAIDPSVSPQKAATASLGVGVLGGLIGAKSGALANKLGISDIDTILASGGTQGLGNSSIGLGKRVIGGAIQEGPIEEGMQSAIETGLQNYAENKPITQGMARNVVEGSLAGTAIGAGINALTFKPKSPLSNALAGAGIATEDTVTPVVDEATTATNVSSDPFINETPIAEDPSAMPDPELLDQQAVLPPEPAQTDEIDAPLVEPFVDQAPITPTLQNATVNESERLPTAAEESPEPLPQDEALLETGNGDVPEADIPYEWETAEPNAADQNIPTPEEANVLQPQESYYAKESVPDTAIVPPYFPLKNEVPRSPHPDPADDTNATTGIEPQEYVDSGAESNDSRAETEASLDARDVILKNDGNPFQTEQKANNAIAMRKALSKDTHEVIPYQDGFAIVEKQENNENQDSNQVLSDDHGTESQALESTQEQSRALSSTEPEAPNQAIDDYQAETLNFNQPDNRNGESTHEEAANAEGQGQERLLTDEGALSVDTISAPSDNSDGEAESTAITPQELAKIPKRVRDYLDFKNSDEARSDLTWYQKGKGKQLQKAYDAFIEKADREKLSIIDRYDEVLKHETTQQIPHDQAETVPTEPAGTQAVAQATDQPDITQDLNAGQPTHTIDVNATTIPSDTTANPLPDPNASIAANGSDRVEAAGQDTARDRGIAEPSLDSAGSAVERQSPPTTGINQNVTYDTLPDLIKRSDGAAFPTEAKAKAAFKTRGIDSTTHDVVSVADGFAIAPVKSLSFDQFKALPRNRQFSEEVLTQAYTAETGNDAPVVEINNPTSNEGLMNATPTQPIESGISTTQSVSIDAAGDHSAAEVQQGNASPNIGTDQGTTQDHQQPGAVPQPDASDDVKENPVVESGNKVLDVPNTKDAKAFVVDHIVKNSFDDYNAAKESAGKAFKEKYNIDPSKIFGNNGFFRSDDFTNAVHDGLYENIKSRGASLPVPINETDVNRENFRRAFYGTSFRPEERGDSQVQSYVKDMVATYESLEKLAKTPEQKQLLNDGFAQYKDKYISKLNAYMAAHSNVMSSMITGPAKFPTRRNEKRNATTDKRLNELVEYSKKAVSGMKKAIFNSGKPEQSPLEESQSRLASLEKHHQLMKDVNKVVKNKKLSNEEKVSKIQELGLTDKQAHEILKPDFAGRVGFADYQLINNLNTIKRLKDRVAELSSKETAKQEQLDGNREEIYHFEGGRVEVNRIDDRVRIFHEEKPSKEVIANLKRLAFKWSPTNQAWQRQATPQGIKAAIDFTGAKANAVNLNQTRPENVTPKFLFSKGAKTTGKIDNPAHLVDIALSRNDGNKAFSELGNVSKEVVEKIKQTIGIDVSGWQHSIDEASIRHVFDSHGNSETESKRGQIAITRDDIERLLDVVNSPDNIDKGNEPNTIELSKRIGNEVFVVQEIRTGRNKLALKTMWKKPLSARDAPLKASPAETSVTFGKQAFPYNVSIAQPHTKASLIQALTQTMDGLYGKGWTDRLFKTGKFEVISRDEAVNIAGDKAKDAQGFYDEKTGKSYLVYENIDSKATPEELKGLMLHEIGVHARQLGKTDAAFQSILNQVEQLKETSTKVKEAFDQVPEDTPPDNVVEEALGYLIQKYPSLPIVRKFLAWLRNAIRNISPHLSQLANTLNTDDLAYMANAALRSAPNTLTNNKTDSSDVKFSMDDHDYNKQYYIDDNENYIVYDDGSYKISVNNVNNASYVVLWHKEIVKGREYWAKRGSLSTSEKILKLNGTLKNYLTINEISIEKSHQGKGYGKKMYKAIIDFAGKNIIGIASYTPNRVNKKQVPTIYKHFNSYKVGDYDVIPINNSNKNNDIRYSRSPVSQAIAQALTPSDSKKPLGWLAGLFQRNHLIDFASDALQGISNQYADTIKEALHSFKTLSLAKTNKVAQHDRALDQQYKSFKDKLGSAKAALELGRVQGLATNLDDFDPDNYDDIKKEYLGTARILKPEEREAFNAFQALPEKSKEVYRSMREDYKKDFNQKRDALIARINDFPADRDTKDKIIKELNAHFDQVLSRGVYFPNARFGNIVVTGKKGADKIVEFVEGSFFSDGMKQAEALAKAMQEQGYQTNITTKTKFDAAMMQSDAANSVAALAIDTVKALRDGSKDIQDDKVFDEINQLLLDALPDTSYRKHFIHRKGIKGYSKDTLRAYANTRHAAAKHIASLLYDHKINKSLKDAKKGIKDIADTGDTNTAAINDIVDELILREAKLKESNISQASQVLTSLGFFGALGFNISSAAVNLLQVPGVAFPELAGKHGVDKAFTALNGAYKLVFNRQVLSKESGFNLVDHPDLQTPQHAALKRALKQLIDDGKIDITMTHDAISMGENPAYSDNALTRTVGGVAKYSGLFFHIAEALNRQIVGVAAFNLEYAKSANYDQALSAAVDAIDRTQFDYSAGNRARYMMSNTARVVTLFKAYALGMSYYMGRNIHHALKGESPEIRLAARKTIATQFAMTFITSGLFGLPIGAEMLAGIGGVAGFKRYGAKAAIPGAILGIALFQALLAGLGADDDDEVETDFRNWLTDNFDTTTAEWISKGPLRLLPFGDISERTGLDHLWWRQANKELEGKDQFNQFASLLMGPLGNQAANFFVANSMRKDGEYGRMFESMTPAAVRNIIAGSRLAGEGARTIKGDKIVDREMTNGEVLNKMLGFNPSVVANAQAANAAISKQKQKLDLQKRHLINRWMGASSKGRLELLKTDIQQFNKTVPVQQRITLGVLMRSLKARKAADKLTDNGLYLSKKQNYLRSEGRFYHD